MVAMVRGERLLAMAISASIAMVACKDAPRSASSPPPVATANSPAEAAAPSAPELVVAHPATTTLPPEQVAQLEALIDESVRARGYPSAAFGLVVDGKLAWHKAYGHRVAGGSSPVTKDTVFRIGSLTKIITAMAVLQLRDAGKLSLDDLAGKYLPELATTLSPPGKTPVTLRHLLTHTSGIPRLGKGLDYTRGDRDVTEKEMIDSAQGVELEFEPGTKASYSNLGMALAGLVVTRASGQPYRRYVDKHILQPLAMTSSVWDRGAVAAGRLADGHVHPLLGDGFVVGPAHWRMGAVEPAGGLYSSIDDLARLAAFALTATASTKTDFSSVLRSESLREMAIPPSEGLPHGLAWIVKKHPDLGLVLAHEGSTGDYGAWIAAVPEKGVALVGLLGTGELDELASNSQACLSGLEAVIEQREPEPAVPTPMTTVSDVMNRLMPLFAAPSDDAIKTLFTAEFLQKVAPAVLQQSWSRLHQTLGDCTT
jgi:CubicO group peptidase (beta-lactamase class C family)